MFYKSIIKQLSSKSSSIILFHSATGKDSIMLLDLLAKEFDTIHCVFMYIVKDLQYENSYIEWAKRRYKNVIFHHTPHYCLSSFIKYGYLGIKKDAKIPNNKISEIDKRFKQKLNIEYSVYGFKKIDGITRRLMLNENENGINEKTKKVYPLKDLSNADVLKYISDNDLIPPFSYSTKKPSSGCDISTNEFLHYIEKKYPQDLEKIFKQFPFCEAKLFQYKSELHELQAKRNHHY